MRWIVLAALGWSGVAWGQAVPNGDFELLDEGWSETSLECVDPPDMQPPVCGPTSGAFSYDAAQARGAYAGHLVNAGGVDYWLEPAVVSAPFRVTHQTLSWATYPFQGSVTVLADGLPVGDATVAGPPSADAFSNWEKDLSAACGAEVEIEVASGDLWFDDFALGGAVCPELVDGDGDGACPEGIDLDGDGTCVGGGEPTFDVYSDCDDADPAVGACLSMDHPGWAVAGADFTATVVGVSPGETVHLVASEAEGAACPAILGGGCMDLADPLVHLASGVADATGTAEITFPLRLRTEPFVRWYLQASTLTGTRTAVSEVWTLPPDHGPAPEAGGVLNGDMEDSRLVGWPPNSAAYVVHDPYGDWHYACPAPSSVTAPARGARALELQDATDAACDGAVVGWPFLVTHQALSWAGQGSASVSLHRVEDDAVAAVPRVGPVLADDGFEEWAKDMRSECGTVRYLRISSTGAFDYPVVDGVQLGGSVCRIYVDRDGDGACPSGVDLDGDGFCVSDGEPDLPTWGTDLPLEIPLLDFEDALDGITAAEAAPVEIFGDVSGRIEAWWWVQRSVDVIVTHESLAFRATTLGVGDWEPAEVTAALRDGGAYTNRLAVTVDLPGGPGDWSQHLLDTSSMCGDVAEDLVLEVPLDVAGWELASYYAHADDILVDEVGFAGAPCALFVDGDGDGLCSEGLDTDADGLCVGAGEPTPGTVQDVDDPSVAP